MTLPHVFSSPNALCSTTSVESHNALNLKHPIFIHVRDIGEEYYQIVSPLIKILDLMHNVDKTMKDQFLHESWQTS